MRTYCKQQESSSLIFLEKNSLLPLLKVLILKNEIAQKFTEQ